MYTVFNSIEEAGAVVRLIIENGGDPDGFIYTIIPDPKASGRAIIKVSDLSGMALGNL